MRIPKKIHIGPFVHPIVFVKELKDDNGAELYGKIMFKNEGNVILLSKGMQESRNATTFMHEILHGINALHGIEGMPEEAVTNIAVTLIDTIRRNKLDFLDAVE